ncbi:MAG: dephospho-CoA kinase [Kiritimatiellae bacterium]|nr:dephospho-CoA kinase [Kiritimatiellia bacterium]
MKKDDGAIAVGITGGIGCGKSEVGRILIEQGISVLDTDTVAHQMVEPGKTCYRQIIDHFGQDLLKENGTIDRDRLGKKVFSNPSQREVLNQIIHPNVKRYYRKWVQDRLKEQEMAAVIVPLLYEINETLLWNAVICVSSPFDVVIARLKKRGFNEHAIQQRVEAQWPLSKKEERADYIIMNDATLDDLKTKTKKVVFDLLKKEKRNHV